VVVHEKVVVVLEKVVVVVHEKVMDIASNSNLGIEKQELQQLIRRQMSSGSFGEEEECLGGFWVRNLKEEEFPLFGKLLL